MIETLKPFISSNAQYTTCTKLDCYMSQNEQQWHLFIGACDHQGVAFDLSSAKLHIGLKTPIQLHPMLIMDKKKTRFSGGMRYASRRKQRNMIRDEHT